MLLGKSEKKQTKKSEKTEAEVVLVKPAPWKHVVKISDDFGPEDVKVYVRDGRIRVEGRRERNVGGDGDVVEVVEVNRELQPPSDVILDDLSVFFRSGGRLELEAPRRVQRQPIQQPELVKKLESMSVDDIEKDAQETTATVEAQSSEQTTETDDVKNEKASSGEHVEKSEDRDDWEMLPEEEVKDDESEEGTTDEQKQENNDDVKDRLEEAAEDEEKQLEEEATQNEESEELKDRLEEGVEKLENSQKVEESSVKISELEEITTKPIVEEPREATLVEEPHEATPAKEPHETTPAETEVKESNLTVRIVSEDQQQLQIDENAQLMVMNLAGFEPRDVTVRLDGDRVSVRAVRVTEEEGFLSRKESFRSCRVLDRVRPTELTCTMGPEAKLVITTPSA